MSETQILDDSAFKRTINRLAHEIVEKNPGRPELAIVGIRTRGEYVARRILKRVTGLQDSEVPLGILDITLYRDDLRGKIEQPRLQRTDILFDVAGKTLILVDDVLFTGRTIRSALNALMDLGRPRKIQLLVLVDRGHRELPIKPDYVGKNIPTGLEDSVRVMVEEVDGEDGIYLLQRSEEDDR